MIILRFRAENHRSLRDEAELSLVAPSLKTNLPPDGDWIGATTRVAGIYGANASGKSTVVDALKFMRRLILHSATVLTQSTRLPHSPFLLDSDCRESPSAYALDFVHDGTRYQYGFSLTSHEVVSEWLLDYPKSKQRTLFVREGREYEFGRGFTGAPRRHSTATGTRELFLSKAASNGHELLHGIRNAFESTLTITDFTENDRNRRLHQITEGLASDEIALADVITLLRVADIGIADVEIDEAKIPEEVRELAEVIRRHLEEKNAERRDANASRGFAATDREGAQREFGSKETEAVQRALRFRHFGPSEDTYLPLEAQSTGTLSWLSIALPAVNALRSGGALVVDELDASLHPQLSQVIVRIFKDSEYNKTGAQLIFTTHDTFLLSPQSDAHLSAAEVWLTEKGLDGATSLFSLAEFPTRVDHNFAHRYLNGRYGGVPRTARSFLASLLEAPARGESDA